ncbi:MAG: phosphoglucomutase/phosphomannomutase family protein, partial [Lachnospiraceae bacterium]|nr:phosphoglucomutase/phosphomannomutase family protein [Lachnospiraceae bacterium]
AALIVEMLAVTGMKLSDIIASIKKEYGAMAFVERDYRFSKEKKEEIVKRLLADKELPEIPFESAKISYLDGLKIYFADGGWISVRFSGTEPLLRIFTEMKETSDAEKLIGIFESFLELS